MPAAKVTISPTGLALLFLILSGHILKKSKKEKKAGFSKIGSFEPPFLGNGKSCSRDFLSRLFIISLLIID
jgi:hypothetical protein